MSLKLSFLAFLFNWNCSFKLNAWHRSILRYYYWTISHNTWNLLYLFPRNLIKLLSLFLPSNDREHIVFGPHFCHFLCNNYSFHIYFNTFYYAFPGKLTIANHVTFFILRPLLTLVRSIVFCEHIILVFFTIHVWLIKTGLPICLALWWFTSPCPTT